MNDSPMNTRAMTESPWSKLAAPLPQEAVSWRQQGKPKPRGTDYYAPFVAYTDAQTVRDRLDAVVPGEWDLTLELLPPGADEDGVAEVAFKARLKVLGVHREDVGTGKDYKQAATDAFKRAAVRFGIAHELYTDYEIVWVKVDSDSKYAKALENPADVWARKSSGAKAGAVQGHTSGAPREASAPAPSPAVPPADEPACPKCGGLMWDNRLTKKNPKAPDHKCRNRQCDGVIWPEKPNGGPPKAAVKALDLAPVPDNDFPPPLADTSDDLPF